VAVLAASCDGVIPVVRWGQTRVESINNMLSTLRSFETPLLGAVLNAVPKRYNKHHETAFEPVYPNAPSARHQSQMSSNGRTQRSLETTR
jgi:Mrp family chromosome partitioning ATPase